MKSEQEDMPAIELPAILGASKPLVQDLYDGLKSIAKKKRFAVSLPMLQSGLTKKIKEISCVKTLLHRDEAEVITSFYTPQHLELPGNGRTLINDPVHLDEFQRLIVAGVAGQGKSMLFRYLATQDIVHRRLPVFCELRNYGDFPSLLDLIKSEIENLGLPSDEDLLDIIFASSTTTLYLDAFDEVPLQQQQKARKEIEDFARRHDVRIRLSSRPSLRIELSNFFRVSRISYLTGKERLTALKNICESRDDWRQMTDELEKSHNDLLQLLDTPLMVTLLVLHRRLTSKFPDTEQAFFGDLFEVLLRRHDQTKGYQRDRYSTVSELGLTKIFDYISFVTRKDGLVELPTTKLRDHCHDGANFYNIHDSGDSVLQDIAEGTNLLLEEGATCRYSHKTIQEFHAARFLVNQTEGDCSRFLLKRVKKWNEWEQVLAFVEIQEEYMFKKYFLIPHLSWLAFGETNRRIQEGWKPSKKCFHRIFGNDHIGLGEDRTRVFYGCGYMSSCYLFRKFPTLDTHHLCEDLDMTKVPAIEIEDGDDRFSFARDRRSQGFELYSVGKLLDSELGDAIRAKLEPQVVEHFSNVFRVYEFIDHREKCSGLFD